MLSELYQLLCRLLADAGFTAYAEDSVPDHAVFPYVACRIEPPLSLHDTGSVHLTCWLRSSSAHAERLAAGDVLLSLIPSGGLKLPLSNGLAVLYRAESHPISYPECKGALGVCIRHGLRVLAC